MCKSPFAYGGPSCSTNTSPGFFSHCIRYSSLVIRSRHCISALTGSLCFIGKSVLGSKSVDDHLFLLGFDDGAGTEVVDAYRNAEHAGWRPDHVRDVPELRRAFRKQGPSMMIEQVRLRLPLSRMKWLRNIENRCKEVRSLLPPVHVSYRNGVRPSRA